MCIVYFSLRKPVHVYCVFFSEKTRTCVLCIFHWKIPYMCIVCVAAKSIKDLIIRKKPLAKTFDISNFPYVTEFIVGSIKGCKDIRTIKLEFAGVFRSFSFKNMNWLVIVKGTTETNCFYFAPCFSLFKEKC